jgi:hypothetical protein
MRNIPIGLIVTLLIIAPMGVMVLIDYILQFAYIISQIIGG